MRGRLQHEDYSIGEEISHAISHGIGALLSMAGLVIMVVQAARHAGAQAIVGVSIFGACMVLLYTASTLYHALTPAKTKMVFQLMDHAAIYGLIAGSYTPFALIVLGDSWGWSTFGTVWGLALLGIIYEVVFKRPWKWLSLAFYLGLGWILVIPARILASLMPSAALWLIVAGGVAYSAGAIFYAWRGFRYHHMVWHLFVMLGTALHWYCVIKYVIPQAG